MFFCAKTFVLTVSLLEHNLHTTTGCLLLGSLKSSEKLKQTRQLKANSHAT